MKAIGSITAIILAAMLSMGIFGCSKSDDADSSTSNAASEQESSSSEENTQKEAAEEAVDPIGTWEITSYAQNGVTYGKEALDTLRAEGSEFFINIEEDGKLYVVTADNKTVGAWTESSPSELSLQFSDCTGTMSITGSTTVIALTGDSFEFTMEAEKSSEKKDAGVSATAQTEASGTADSQATEAEQKPAEDGLINADKFNAIAQGMSYEEVVGIIGSEGEMTSTSSVAGIETTSYQWESDSWGIATVMFQNGAVVNKTQVGVGGSEAKITKEQFERIENGMTYEQVVEIIGGEGSLMSETELMGVQMSIYSWEGNSLLANCTITFENNLVSAKSQYGLE